MGDDHPLQRRSQFGPSQADKRTMKKLSRKLAAIVFVGLSLSVGVPASADPGTCPTGWETFPVAANSSGDDNGNGLMCRKLVGGNGNTGEQSNLVDDRSY